MKMDIQRLRNLTTGLLHTDMGHVYQDIEFFTGEKGVMTHMIPRAHRALKPYLREQLTDPQLWDDEYDPDHTGTTEVRAMNAEEKAEFWDRYATQPNPLDGKEVIGVEV